MKSLEEDGFFKEYDIVDIEPAKSVLCDSLTEKFISGDLNDGSANYDDNEFEKIMNLMIVSCLLEGIKHKGYIDSFPDENGEEMYFTTEKGKQYMKYFGENE